MTAKPLAGTFSPVAWYSPPELSARSTDAPVMAGPVL